MPQLGLGTEIGRVSGGAYDSDALAYFARAGIASGTQTPTAYDNAASFNGTNQFLSVADNASINLSGTNFTLSCWYFVSALNTANAYVFGKAVLNLLPLDYGFRINANTTTTQFLWSTSGSYSVLTGPSVVLGAWNHLTIVFDGTNLTMYGNGVAGTPVAMPAAIQNTANPLSIGLAGANNSQYLNGRVAAFGLWKRALTASEVTALFNSGAGRTYASLDSGLLTNLISWWALNGTSSAVSLTDSHGVVTGTPNNLTNNGTVTAPNIGPIVTSLADSRRLISDFVKGIKSLGLWNQMVCWPLRSSQNASTTLTARSLGGLGTFNGTFAGSLPVSAWGSQGITNTSTGFITTNLSVPSIPTHNMVVVNPSSTANQCYCSDLSNANTRGTRAARQTLLVGNGTSFNIISYSNPTINTFRAIDYDVTASLATVSLNGSSIATGSLSALPPTAIVSMGLMAARDELGASQWFPGTMSFYMHFSTNLTTTNVPEVYSLYKQTLGLGLGLP
jgi:hypothetical protein